MKEKINKILWDFAQGKLTHDEATQQVLDLFNVVGRGEQFCSCSFVMIMRDSETDIPYCSKCKKEVNEQN